MSLVHLRQPARIFICQRWLTCLRTQSTRGITVPNGHVFQKLEPSLHVPLSVNSISINSIRNMAKGKNITKEKNKRVKPKTRLSDDEMIQVIDVEEMRIKMTGIIDRLREDYVKNLSLKTGQGIEELEIEFEGEKFPLKELGTISRKGSNLIVLNLTALPDALKPVLNRLNESGMNLNPQQEGTVIYLTLPRITFEHRETLAKNAKTLFQKSKESIMKVSNQYIKEAREKEQYESGLSKDLVFQVCENIKFIAEGMILQCESLFDNKVNELLQTTKQ